jgi:hypothetical protein
MLVFQFQCSCAGDRIQLPGEPDESSVAAIDYPRDMGTSDLREVDRAHLREPPGLPGLLYGFSRVQQ